jgi:hypothetical protein
MSRSICFSAGLFIALWGVSFLFIDKIVLNSTDVQREAGFRGLFARNVAREKVVDPPEWAAFTLISVGVVTMLYSVALPKKQQP